MDKKLITAYILSTISALLIALSYRLSIYTVFMLPIFFIVLVFSILKSKKAHAIWLGFILYFILETVNPAIALYPSFLTPTFFLSLIAFILGFASFYPRINYTEIPQRSVWIVVTVLFFLYVIFYVDLRIIYFESYITHKKQFDLTEVYLPSFLIFLFLQVALNLCVFLFLLLRNRFTYYVLAPILLVYNTIFSLSTFFSLSFRHLTIEELFNHIASRLADFSTYREYIYFPFAAISLLITIVYFARYERKC